MRTWLRTWGPAPARSAGLNRWTQQNPWIPETSVVSVPGGTANAVAGAGVVADWTAGSELTSWSWLFSTPLTVAKTRYSYVVPSTRPVRSVSVNVLLVGSGKMIGV